MSTFYDTVKVLGIGLIVSIPVQGLLLMYYIKLVLRSVKTQEPDVALDRRIHFVNTTIETIREFTLPATLFCMVIFGYHLEYLYILVFIVLFIINLRLLGVVYHEYTGTHRSHYNLLRYGHPESPGERHKRRMQSHRLHYTRYTSNSSSQQNESTS